MVVGIITGTYSTVFIAVGDRQPLAWQGTDARRRACARAPAVPAAPQQPTRKAKPQRKARAS